MPHRCLLEPIEPRTLFSVGTLDPTAFPTGTGLATFPLPSSTLFSPAALVTQPDGKLVVAGTATPSSGTGSSDFLLLRLNPDGSPDTSFGPSANGTVTLDFQGTTDIAGTLLLQSDGKLLVAGSSQIPGAEPIANHPDTALAAARLNPDGSLDPSFNSTGKLTLDFTPIRFHSYGDPIQEGPTAAVATASAQIAGGKLLLAGTMFADDYLAGDMFVMRLNPDGTADPSFGYSGSGLTPAPFDGDTFANALLVQSDGKIVLAGSDTSGRITKIALARLKSNGQYDTAFGTGGHLSFSFSETFDSALALAQQPDGKLLVGGTVTRGSLNDPAQADGELALLRLTKNNGKPDKSFGARGLNGLALTPLPGQSLAAISSIQVQKSTGAILVGGKATTVTPDGLSPSVTPFVARYTNKGALDKTFGTNGITLLPTTPISAAATPTRTDDIIVGSLDNSVGAQSRELQYRAFLNDPAGTLALTRTGAIRTLATGPTDSSLTLAALTPDGPDLTATLTPPTTKSLKPGSKTSATLTTKNAGTLLAKGKFKVSLYTSPTPTLASDATPFYTTTLNANLKPGKSTKSPLHFTLPSTLPHGTYYLIATLNPTNSPIQELSTTNNTATKPITI